MSSIDKAAKLLVNKPHTRAISGKSKKSFVQYNEKITQNGTLKGISFWAIIKKIFKRSCND